MRCGWPTLTDVLKPWHGSLPFVGLNALIKMGTSVGFINIV